MGKQAELDELKNYCMACSRCQLAARRTNLVFGDGSAEASVMFVGEGPGADEDRLGLPFVGRAGQLLNHLLGDVGLKREEVYIANIIKCRPPENRDPLPQEISSCREYLFAQIAIIQPRIMCMLGRHSAITLLGQPDFKISKEHGRPVKWNGITALPLYHPAAALHQQHFMEPLREDFRRLKQILAEEPDF
jgi:uracil-DNA glycosylase